MPQIGVFSNRALLAAVAAAALLQAGAVTLPGARNFFGLSASMGADWCWIAPLALAPVTVVEVAKIVVTALRR
jgi:hypothetical protein